MESVNIFKPLPYLKKPFFIVILRKITLKFDPPTPFCIFETTFTEVSGIELHVSIVQFLEPFKKIPTIPNTQKIAKNLLTRF